MFCVLNIHDNVFSIEVAKSLDVLDQVIGEFDDGLLSGTDSETTSWKTTRKESTKGQFTINDKIDSIFDELTQEIYSDEKSQRQQKLSDKKDKVIANDIAPRIVSDKPKPGTVFAAKQSFLSRAEKSDRKTQVEVLPYNETNIKANVIKRDKFNVQSFVTRTSVSKLKKCIGFFLHNCPTDFNEILQLHNDSWLYKSMIPRALPHILNFQIRGKNSWGCQ